MEDDSDVSQDGYRVNIPSALHAAVLLGDLIRTASYRSSSDISSDSNSSHLVNSTPHTLMRTPPGLVDGLIAGALVAALLTPVRSRVLKAAGSSMGILPDLVVSSSQVVAAGTCGLYVGSLFGSRVYLQQLTQMSRLVPDEQEDSSRLVDTVCDSNLMKQLLQDYSPRDVGTTSSQYYFAQDPRRLTLESFAKALDACRRWRQKKDPTERLERHGQSNSGVHD